MNDNKNDCNITDLNSILILKDSPNQNPKNILNIEILKINDLIKKKYILAKIKEDIINNKTEKNFVEIKESTDQLNNNIKEQTLKISDTIENNKIELKKLHDEDILFDQNKVQSDIINSQHKLIDSYKKDYDQLKLNFHNLEKKQNENIQSNREFLINNNELKNTISRYVAHNKNLQNNINRLKADFDEASLAISQKDDMSSQIKFYQDENVRLSNEIINIQKNYDTIKNNFSEVENEKNIIYKKIKDLNNSLIKNNIIGTPYVKDTTVGDSINSKILNDITESNVQKEKIKFEHHNQLDDEINDIFK